MPETKCALQGHVLNDLIPLTTFCLIIFPPSQNKLKFHIYDRNICVWDKTLMIWSFSKSPASESCLLGGHAFIT